MPKPTYRFSFRFPFFIKKYNTGLVDDPRTQAEQEADFAHEERLPAGAVMPEDPFGNQKITSSPFYLENQWYVGSCVPHGVGLGLCIERKLQLNEYVRISQLFAYRFRLNYPDSGAWLQGMFDIYKAKGACLYATLPTKVNMSEADATNIVITPNMLNEGLIYAGLEYWTIKNYGNIETLAEIAQKGHGVPLVFYATYAEWSQEYPQIYDSKLDPFGAEVRHCVCILPKSGFIENGIRYVAVQDSAWFANRQLRYLSEDFIKARLYGAGYWDKVNVLGGGAHPHHTFAVTLGVGSTNVSEVTAMQLLLIAENLLPTDCATGYFGGRTLAAVHAFQSKYADEILVPQGLTKPTDLFGPACIKKANLLCK